MMCSSCRRLSKTDRLPHGWKRRAETFYCTTCWADRYTIRSIAMPVAEPVGRRWQDFHEALKEGWVSATAAANWMMTQLYVRDIRRDKEEKMPPMMRVYLYPEVRASFPALAPQTVVTLENATQAAYRKARFQVIWTCSASLPVYRYPVPLPVHNQSWEATIVQERPVVRVRLGNQWWDLRLKGGPRFRRQTAAYRQMVSGEVVRGELALYRVRAQQGKISDRPNRSQTSKFAIMCKMVGWFARRYPDSSHAHEKPQTVLPVRTAEDMLLTAVNANDERVWRYHGEHLRRWAAEHRKLLQGLADDQKVEQRPLAPFADRRTAAASKYRNRMGSAVREIAAQLVAYAVRRNFSAIEYDDSVTGFCPQLPYWTLRTKIQTKCEEMGLGFRLRAAASDPDG
jgi:hypothetical protein